MGKKNKQKPFTIEDVFDTFAKMKQDLAEAQSGERSYESMYRELVTRYNTLNRKLDDERQKHIGDVFKQTLDLEYAKDTLALYAKDKNEAAKCLKHLKPSDKGSVSLEFV